MALTPKRIIGLVHRTKQTAQNQARPTLILIKTSGSKKQIEIKLETENDELDFLLGLFPTKWRDAQAGEDLSEFLDRHLRSRKIKDNEDLTGLQTVGQVIDSAAKKKKAVDDEIRVQIVPAAYEGFAAGDTVAMTLGGSGDRIAYALSHQALEINARVCRLPAAILKSCRGDSEAKDADHKLLVEIFEREPEAFYPTTPRDLDLIRLVEIYRDRTEAMKARIACEQRLRQRFIGKIFLSEEGRYPEGLIEDGFDALKASDPILQALIKEEQGRNNELAKAVKAMDVWTLFEKIEGVGPAIAARIIVAIGDIRRFANEAKLKAFLGVHVLNGGKHGEVPTNKQFVRRRGGAVANWHGDGRQGLFLLGDQFNRRPNSIWGKVLIGYKAKLAAAHPEETDTTTGKKRYTKGHVHKMATWRTLTKFTEWLYREWTALEKTNAAKAEAEVKVA